MLVIFTSPAHSDVTMMGDVAKRVLKLMGLSGAIPGGLSTKDLPGVLEHLKNELCIEEDKKVVVDEGQETEYDDYPTDISVRAFPIVEMLNAAIKEDTVVRWYEK